MLRPLTQAPGTDASISGRLHGTACADKLRKPDWFGQPQQLRPQSTTGEWQ